MKHIGMCACGNKGYKIMKRLAVCERCHKLEKVRKFGELYDNHRLSKMAEKIKSEIAKCRSQILYLE